MDFHEYHRLRIALGTQDSVSKMLGVNIRTLQRREAGDMPINQEAKRAIRSLSAQDQSQALMDIIDSLPPAAIRNKIKGIVALLK